MLKIQKSFKNDINTLYIIGTPLGNLEDMTLRSIRILKEEIDILFCEDTRVSQKLLNHYEIEVKTKSYHEHNKEATNGYVLDLLAQGLNLGLVSDAGMPGISDPGYDIIKLCKENNYNVVILPGPTAFVCALIHSNFINEHFQYVGFLSKQKTKKMAELENHMSSGITTVFYESPHKLIATLELICYINKEHPITVAREITKLNEEYISATAKEALEHFNNNPIKGEFVIVLDAFIKDVALPSISEHVTMMINDGIDKKEAIKKVAKLHGVSKNEVYQIFTND